MSEENTPVKLDNADLQQILVAVFIILVTLVVFALYKRRKGTRRAVLITGLCDSGKTLIFSQLLHNKFVNTYTSIKENIGDYIVKNSSSLRIVDIPGHERLRHKFFDQYKPLARGVVFVVDSVSIQKDVRDAAEFLYDILSDTSLIKGGASFLILCNKQDLSFAKGANAVKSILEKELNTLRITKSSQLESVDPKAKTNNILVGNSNDEFDFELLKVEFAECNGFGKDEAANIDELKKWLLKVA